MNYLIRWLLTQSAVASLFSAAIANLPQANLPQVIPVLVLLKYNFCFDLCETGVIKELVFVAQRLKLLMYQEEDCCGRLTRTGTLTC